MIAIIPARGGSKGLPGKNIKLLNGKPLIAYTIEAALKSSLITRVIVSTEDKAISEIALEHGAEIPFMRPSSLATDTSLSIDTYEYTITKLEQNERAKIDEFVVLQPTSPLRTHKDIDQAINLYKEKKAYSVISFCKEHHPIVWHKYIDKEAKIHSIFDAKLKNRQEEKPSYFPNGAIYVLSKEVLKNRNYYNKDTYAYIMDRKVSVDIDTLEDFSYVEFLMKSNEK